MNNVDQTNNIDHTNNVDHTGKWNLKDVSFGQVAGCGEDGRQGGSGEEEQRPHEVEGLAWEDQTWSAT